MNAIHSPVAIHLSMASFRQRKFAGSPVATALPSPPQTARPPPVRPQTGFGSGPRRVFPSKDQDVADASAVKELDVLEDLLGSTLGQLRTLAKGIVNSFDHANLLEQRSMLQQAGNGNDWGGGGGGGGGGEGGGPIMLPDVVSSGAQTARPLSASMLASRPQSSSRPPSASSPMPPVGGWMKTEISKLDENTYNRQTILQQSQLFAKSHPDRAIEKNATLLHSVLGNLKTLLMEQLSRTSTAEYASKNARGRCVAAERQKKIQADQYGEEHDKCTELTDQLQERDRKLAKQQEDSEAKQSEQVSEMDLLNRRNNEARDRIKELEVKLMELDNLREECDTLKDRLEQEKRSAADLAAQKTRAEEQRLMNEAAMRFKVEECDKIKEQALMVSKEVEDGGSRVKSEQEKLVNGQKEEERLKAILDKKQLQHTEQQARLAALNVQIAEAMEKKKKKKKKK